MNVGDVGIVGLSLGEGPEPRIWKTAAGFADDDAAIVFDLFDDGVNSRSVSMPIRSSSRRVR